MNPTGFTGITPVHTRAQVRAAIAERSAEPFTGDDLILALGWDGKDVKTRTFVAGYLRVFARAGIIEEAGRAEPTGQGRRRLLWRKVALAKPEPVRSSEDDPNDRAGQPWAQVNPYNK